MTNKNLQAETTPQPSGRRGSFSRSQTTRLDDWIVINLDGTVTAMSGKVELGTGVRTALAQIVAEELDVAFERVQMVMGDTSRTPDEGFTAGSMTIYSSGSNLRNAAAEARRALLEQASELLDATPDDLIVENGLISVQHDPARTISYVELMGGKPFNREVTGNAPLKAPETYHIVGTAVQRVDIPAKVAGQISFLHDLRLPGMLHGRVVHPPSVGAHLLSIDKSSVRDIPGIVKIVQRGDFLGIVAEREEQAIRAAKQIKVEWRESLILPRMEDLYTSLRAQPTQDETLAESGDVKTALTQAVRQIDATYYQPYHAHASIGPACAVADVHQDGVTLWSSTQGPFLLRDIVAQLINVSADKVQLIHMEGSGCYGQNGSDDVTADAAVLSQAVGKPVRVQWSREEEFTWEPKAPAMVMEVHGGLDAQGNVIAWDYNVWSPSHAGRPRASSQLLTALLLSGQSAQPPQIFFGGSRNATNNYAFPNQRVAIHWIANSLLRVSSFRSLGGASNTFANESFMDELAAAAQIDALEFRLRHLHDPRAHAVLHAVADKVNWETRPSPQHLPKEGIAKGRGIAYVQYENDQAFVACVAYVQVDLASGVVRVERIVIAHDCGLIINPDGVKNQIEGNVIQSLSRALKEEVKFEGSRITSVDWDSYPILKFSEVPEVDIILINRPEQSAIGAGEPATVTTAAAVANAIFDATGARMRQVPFTPERIKAALG